MTYVITPETYGRERWNKTHLVPNNPTLLGNSVRSFVRSGMTQHKSELHTVNRICHIAPILFLLLYPRALHASSLQHMVLPSLSLAGAAAAAPSYMMRRSSLCWVDILCSILCRLYLDKLSPDSNHLFILTCATSNAWLFHSTRVRRDSTSSLLYRT